MICSNQGVVYKKDYAANKGQPYTLMIKDTGNPR